MKQYTLFSDDPGEMLARIGELRKLPEYQNAAARLLLIFSQEPGGPSLHARVDHLTGALPEVRIVGLTMASFPLPPNKEHLKSGAVYTLLLLERSRVDLYHYNCREMSAEEAGKRFRREIRYREHVAGILVFSAGVAMEIDRFLTAISQNNRHDIPVIGAEAGSDDIPFIFGDFGGDNRGIAALVFSGRSLHMQYNYDMGWKAIGKDMRVTGTDGNYCVSTIDGQPAASIYQKYLGVETNRYFVENVREFPLVTDRGNRKAVRCPSGYDEDGKLYFIAKLNVGDVVRLSYANPRRLTEDTRAYADAMKGFEPQAVLLIVCENRAKFLGKQTFADIGSYMRFAPQTAWARGFAAIMLDREGGGVVNSAILSVGMREGSPRGENEEYDAVLPAAPRGGAIPLNERLAMFLEQTTKELEDMAVAAEAANTAKSAFLSSMSHEIRTPINAILGMNEMILRESGEQEILEYAKNINIAGMSLLSIISDILDFSKIEAGRMDLTPENYEVQSLVSDLVNLVWLRAEEKGLTLEVAVDPRIPHILYGDEMRIKQVITNLLSNAVKYTERGTVRLEVEYQVLDGETVALHVSVEDTGYGIKPENLARLFNAFDRIDLERTKKIEGAGLGLNITQQLLALMGSRLEVESVYGEGSRFSFALKQKVVEWDEIGERSAAPHGERRKKNRNTERFVAPEARVLVVDDAPMNLAVISGLLKRTQIVVETADGGQRCLDLFREKDYDLVFLDHRMPNMDGIETLEHLREMFPRKFLSTPVISLTANAVSGAREQYMEAGFTDYLTKPVMADELERMLLKYLPPRKIVREGVDPELAEDAERLPGWLTDIRKLDTGLGLGCCGSARDYLAALTIFARSIRARSAEIERFYEAGDWENYTIRVHALKSMARSIGATDLSGLAAHLENAGDARELETIRDRTGQLLEMYRNLEEPLRPLLAAAEAEADKPEVSVRELLEAVEGIRELAESFDYGSIQMIADELGAYRVPEAYAAAWAGLSEAVGRADWEKIRAAADQFMESEGKP